MPAFIMPMSLFVRLMLQNSHIQPSVHIFLRYDNIHLVYGLTEETTEAYNVKSLGNKMICAGNLIYVNK